MHMKLGFYVGMFSARTCIQIIPDLQFFVLWACFWCHPPQKNNRQKSSPFCDLSDLRQKIWMTDLRSSCFVRCDKVFVYFDDTKLCMNKTLKEQGVQHLGMISWAWQFEVQYARQKFLW